MVFRSDDIDLSDVEETPSSPIRPEKRTADHLDADNDTFVTANVPANGNLQAMAKRYAGIKKLRPDQCTEVESFLNETANGREARSFVTLLDLGNRVDKILVHQPVWGPSDAMLKNILHYVAATSLSSHLTTYRGNHGTKLVTQKLMELVLDLPENLRHDIAGMIKLEDAVSEAFTQRRSTIKKELRDSVSKKHPGGVYKPLEENECLDIFRLTQNMVKGTRCVVTVELCARIAIMRKAYTKQSDSDFWLMVDAVMEALRKKGDYKKERIARLVKDVLKKDRAKYGVDNYTIDEGTVSDMQHAVDTLVQASNATPSVVPGTFNVASAGASPTASSVALGGTSVPSSSDGLGSEGAGG